MNIYNFTNLVPLSLAQNQGTNPDERSPQPRQLPFHTPLPNITFPTLHAQNPSMQVARITLPGSAVPVLIIDIDQFHALMRGQNWTLYEDAYVGPILNGKRHGYGTCIYTTRDRYDGEWKDNKRDGQGTMVFSNGESYVGYWKEDKMHGNGSFSRLNGDCLEAEWIDGIPSSPVTYHYANGERYEGQWANNLQNGRGVFHYASGGQYIRFEGSWDAGNKHGIGKLYFADGRIASETWDHGTLINQQL